MLVFRFFCSRHQVWLCDPGGAYNWWECGCSRDNGGSHVSWTVYETETANDARPPVDRLVQEQE